MGQFFKNHRFLHRQGSGNISESKLSTADIYDLMDDLSQQYPWMGNCVKKIAVTNIGRQHELPDLLRPANDIIMDADILMNDEK